MNKNLTASVLVSLATSTSFAGAYQASCVSGNDRFVISQDVQPVGKGKLSFNVAGVAASDLTVSIDSAMQGLMKVIAYQEVQVNGETYVIWGGVDNSTKVGSFTLVKGAKDSVDQDSPESKVVANIELQCTVDSK